MPYDRENLSLTRYSPEIDFPNTAVRSPFISKLDVSGFKANETPPLLV